MWADCWLFCCSWYLSSLGLYLPNDGIRNARMRSLGSRSWIAGILFFRSRSHGTYLYSSVGVTPRTILRLLVSRCFPTHSWHLWSFFLRMLPFPWGYAKSPTTFGYHSILTWAQKSGWERPTYRSIYQEEMCVSRSSSNSEIYWRFRRGITVAFYKQKQKRRGGAEEKYVEAIKISPDEGKPY